MREAILNVLLILSDNIVAIFMQSDLSERFCHFSNNFANIREET
jgi:hypothetical protein